MELLLLCWEFFRTGLLAVGGGMATVPFLTQMAQKYPQWFTLAELADMIAVSESTPGPIGINMATYAGFRVAGIPGALLTTTSLVLPSFVLLIFIARALAAFRKNTLVQAGFSALRPAVTGLIAAAGFSVLQIALFQNGVFSPLLLALFLVFAAATQIKVLQKVHPIAYIVLAAALGIILRL